MAKSKNDKWELRCPRGEDTCVTCCDRSGAPIFLITSKPLTGVFYLYEFTDDGLVRLGKGQSPLELEEKFNVRKRIGAD